nr:uncharacterized protein LOC101788548 [Cavia porcellus]
MFPSVPSPWAVAGGSGGLVCRGKKTATCRGSAGSVPRPRGGGAGLRGRCVCVAPVPAAAAGARRRGGLITIYSTAPKQPETAGGLAAYTWEERWGSARGVLRHWGDLLGNRGCPSFGPRALGRDRDFRGGGVRARRTQALPSLPPSCVGSVRGAVRWVDPSRPRQRRESGSELGESARIAQAVTGPAVAPAPLVPVRFCSERRGSQLAGRPDLPLAPGVSGSARRAERVPSSQAGAPSRSSGPQPCLARSSLLPAAAIWEGPRRVLLLPGEGAAGMQMLSPPCDLMVAQWRFPE